MQSERKLKTKLSQKIPKFYNITVWIALSSTVIVCLTDLFRRIYGNWPHASSYEPMRIVTSVCFISAALVLALQHIKRSIFIKYLILTIWCFFLLISVLSFYENIVDFTIIRLPSLAEFKIFSLFLSYGTRMALLTSASFLILSAIMFLIYLKKNAVAHLLAIPVSLITYFFLLSYILKVSVRGSENIPLSLNTSLALAGICMAILMMNPYTWLLRVFSSGNTGGIIARQLLIPLIFVPVIIGWLMITGERLGWFTSETGSILVALVYTICFALFVWLTAHSINKIDIRRLNLEEITAKSHSRIELMSETASRLLVSENPQLIINQICNQVKEFLDCDLFFNFLVDDENKLLLNAYAGIDEKTASRMNFTDFGTAVSDTVVREGERIVSEYIQDTKDNRTEFLRSLGIRAYVCHPLLSHNKVIGTLSFGSKSRDKFSSDDMSLLKIVADQVAIAIGRIMDKKALRESEDRFRTIAESMAVPIAITRINDSTFLFTNDAYDLTFNYKKGKLKGTNATGLYNNTEERSKLKEELKYTGFKNNFEICMLKSDGTSIWVLASIRKIIFEGEPAYISALMEIDQLKKAQKELLQLNRTLNAMSKSSQAMMHTTNEMHYLKDVCRIVIEDCGYLMVWIGYARDDENKTVEPMAYHGFDRGYIEKMNISWADNERGRGPTGTAIRTGQPAICRNMHNDPDFAPWKEEAIKRGYSSSIVLPLVADAKVFGAISIYARDPDAFTEEDTKLLSGLAKDMAYGITYIRLAVSEKNAAKTIKESEEKYRVLFEEMTEGFALHELLLDEHGQPYDYKFLNVNPAFERQTGMKAQNVIGKTAKELFPVLENHWLKSYSEVALTGKSIEFENYSSDLNSYYRVSAFSPRKKLFAVIFENVTQRVLAEKELHNTKNYLENLINYANAPIIVWNTATEIQLFNHSIEHLTGYKSEEMLGKKLDLLFPESSFADSNKKIRTALTKNWEAIEIPILTKNKQIKTILWNSANIFDPDSNKIVSTIAQGHDITERIRAENDVKAAIEKLDLALENANIGIWTWDILNDNVEWDERISRMFGQDHSVQKSNFEAFEKFIYEDDLPHFARAVNKALNEDNILDTIFRTRQNNGEYSYIDAKARVQKDQSGKPVKMTGVCLDITAMQQNAEKTLFNLNEDLLRSNRELEQFAYVASHDLQEPLRMVSSFTQLLNMRYGDKLDKDAKEFINFAVDGAQRMQRLINDLLQYSRINTRGKTLTVTDMNDALAQTLHILSIKIKEKNAFVTSDPLPSVYADDSQMIQLFQNLIENGLKFCDKKPKIHISSIQEHDHYQFSVRDNGIGIEPQYFNRIFQIFQRLHLRDQYGGTGIGLAICKRITERHGGKIWVESKKGKGTTFYFTIRKA